MVGKYGPWFCGKYCFEQETHLALNLSQDMCYFLRRRLLQTRLGSNSNLLEWKETREVNQNHVVNMRTNDSTLIVVLKNEVKFSYIVFILSFNYANITHDIFSLIYHGYF